MSIHNWIGPNLDPACDSIRNAGINLLALSMGKLVHRVTDDNSINGGFHFIVEADVHPNGEGIYLIGPNLSASAVWLVEFPCQ